MLTSLNSHIRSAAVKMELYQLSQSLVLTIFMFVLTEAPPSQSLLASPVSVSALMLRVFIYSPGPPLITSELGVRFLMFASNVISGHFIPIHFTSSVTETLMVSCSLLLRL